MLGVFVAGTLFMLAFPAYSTRAAQWIGKEPLRSLGLGFVILVCLPVLVVLLLVTIVGIPLALIVLMLYLLLLFLGWVTAAMFVGQKLLGFMRGDSRPDDALEAARPAARRARVVARRPGAGHRWLGEIRGAAARHRRAGLAGLAAARRCTPGLRILER